MKTFAICFVALFAVAFARSVDVDYVNGEVGFDDEIERSDDRIFGGEETTIEQHPHQISWKLLVDDHSHRCGGSIISPVRALTAAHCPNRSVPANKYQITAGTANRSDLSSAQTRILYRFLIHDRYNAEYLRDDIAILFWEKPLTFGANVRSIRLPTANAAVPYGQIATSSGWGYSRPNSDKLEVILRVISMPLVSNEDCNRLYKGSELNVTADMVCLAGEAGQGVCGGDSGGPLVNNNTLIGITSWTQRPCGSKPSVYTRVAFFIDWIKQNIN